MENRRPSTNPPGHPVLFPNSLEGQLPGLVCGFTGILGYAHQDSFPDAIRQVVAAATGTGEFSLITLAQPHSANIHDATRHSADGGPVVASSHLLAEDCDGASSTVSHPRLLAVRVADCVPVLAVDAEIGAYGALHAGWRGAAAGILPNLLNFWRSKGSSLQSVRIAFGPAIGMCCYEVKKDCVSAFRMGHLRRAMERRGDRYHLYLHGILTHQAREFGVSEAQIEAFGQCTKCHKDSSGAFPFASYRRSTQEGQSTDGRNAGFIGVLG